MNDLIYLYIRVNRFQHVMCMCTSYHTFISPSLLNFFAVHLVLLSDFHHHHRAHSFTPHTYRAHSAYHITQSCFNKSRE
jgi:hypothetical protein